LFVSRFERHLFSEHFRLRTVTIVIDSIFFLSVLPGTGWLKLTSIFVQLKI
jgi:hypothetical protein